MSASQVAQELGPQAPSVVLRGSRLTMTVDNQVDGDYRPLGIIVSLLDDNGALREIAVGPFRPGRSTSTTRLRDCAQACQLQSLSFGGPSALVEAMHGRATIESFTVDGRPVAGTLDRPWRPQASQIGTKQAVVKTALVGGHVVVTFDAGSPESYAGISPRDVPGVVPVLWGRQATEQERLPTGVSGLFKVRSIGTSESIPFRGPSGVLIDFTAFIRSASQENSDTLVYVWARADTPQSILDQLAARGLAHPETEAAAKQVLDQDAFALAAASVSGLARPRAASWSRRLCGVSDRAQT